MDANAVRMDTGDRPGWGGEAVSDAIYEVVYRQPCQTIRQAMCGCAVEAVAYEIAQTLGHQPAALTALSDDPPHPERCWVALGPDGARLARVGGLDADALNLAFAGLDAGRFERTAA